MNGQLTTSNSAVGFYTFGDKVLPAMRYKFGGHVEPSRRWIVMLPDTSREAPEPAP